MTTALAPTDSRLTAFRRDLAGNLKGFTALLPKDFPPERFARMALNAVQAVPKLLECDRGSLWLALNNAAALGLEPNTALHECAIVPRAGKAMMQPEYRAYVKLAGNAGVQLQAGTIRKGDKIDYRYGDEGFFHFQPAPPWENDGAPVLGYFAYGKTPNGPVFLVWSKKQVEDHRDRYSDSYKRAEADKSRSSPWHTSPNPMGEKTMIHQISRWLPKEIQRLSRVAEAIEAGYQVRPTEGAEDFEILDASIADEAAEPVEKVVEQIDRAPAPAPAAKPADPDVEAANERLLARRRELAGGGAAPAAKAAPAPAAAPPAEPKAGPQPGDAQRLGYDDAGFITIRGDRRHITDSPLRTNQGKSQGGLHCGWCGNEIPVGSTYFEGARGVKAHPGCVEEAPPEAEEAAGNEIDALILDEPEPEPPPVQVGVGPSPEARQAVLDAPEMDVANASKDALSPAQIQALLEMADAGVGREAFLDAAARAIPGLDALDEAHKNAFPKLMSLAMGVTSLAMGGSGR